MSQSVINTLILAGAFLTLFASAEFMYHKLKFRAEITRKYVHLVTGLISMLFPFFIDDHWLVMSLCGSFLLILYVSMFFGFLPSINAVDRITRGSLFYPIIIYGCYLVFDYYQQYIFYYIPILILAVCDPVAALVGKRWPIGKYTVFSGSKTLMGSGSFFVVALTISLLLMVFIERFPIVEAAILSIIIAFVTTIAEAIGHKGYDNLTIPGAAILLLVIVKENCSIL